MGLDCMLDTKNLYLQFVPTEGFKMQCSTGVKTNQDGVKQVNVDKYDAPFGSFVVIIRDHENGRRAVWVIRGHNS